ncbi:MAG TPA: hypothetical protein VFC58_09350 [Desulfosporosinus sp.]|nr:hypothetical protein [Desulfosporosinus sp.]
MKCPKEIRVCPNGWIDCHLCKYDVLCKAGLYEPDISDLGIVVLAAKIAEEVVQAEAVESAYRIKGTWAEHFSKMDEDERWADYRKYHVADLAYKEPVKCMSGPTTPGGSSMKVKKNNKGNIPTVYIWGSTD